MILFNLYFICLFGKINPVPIIMTVIIFKINYLEYIIENRFSSI